MKELIVVMTMSKIAMNDKGTTEEIKTQYFGTKTFTDAKFALPHIKELQGALNALGLRDDAEFMILDTSPETGE